MELGDLEEVRIAETVVGAPDTVEDMVDTGRVHLQADVEVDIVVGRLQVVKALAAS